MSDRWVCKRCVADNEDSDTSCTRCGLIRGAEATTDDQSDPDDAVLTESLAGAGR